MSDYVYAPLKIITQLIILGDLGTDYLFSFIIIIFKKVKYKAMKWKKYKQHVISGMKSIYSPKRYKACSKTKQVYSTKNRRLPDNLNLHL